MATVGGSSVIDPMTPRLGSTLDRPGVGVGDPANLMLVPGDCVAAAVMGRPADRTVLHHGRVVAEGLELL